MPGLAFPRFMARKLADGKTEERKFSSAGDIPPGEGWVTIDEIEGRPLNLAPGGSRIDAATQKALDDAAKTITAQAREIEHLRKDQDGAINYADALEKVLDEVQAAAPPEIQEALKAKRAEAEKLMGADEPAEKPKAKDKPAKK